MEVLKENLHLIFPILFLLYFWYVIRRIVQWFNNRAENAENHKDDLLNVLEEIRDELKELNKKNSNN